MTVFLAVLAPALGLLGLFVGTFMGEWLRRRNRREQFANLIFEKRLEIYEGLIVRVNAGNKLVNAIFDKKFLPEERLELVSTAVHGVAEYCDEHALYLDDEIVVQCMSIFMGCEDIPDAPQDEMDELKRGFNELRMEALRMIAEDSGVAEINRLFKAVNKPRLDGPIIEYYRDLKQKRDSEKKS